MTIQGHTEDLTHQPGVTYALLDDTWRWRRRLVETFEFRSTHHVRVRSSYQLELDAELVRPYAASTTATIRLLLPVTTRPKRPLVGFDIEAQGTSAYLPLRRTLAGLQSGYLAHLLLASPVRDDILDRLPPALLHAICAFTPGVYDEYRRGFARLSRHLHLARYLRSGLAVAVSRRQVAAWERRLEPASKALVRSLNEPPDSRSSSEHVLLALPLLDTAPSSVTEIDRIVRGFAEAVQLAVAHEEHAFLVALAEYGRRWEMIVDAVVPVGLPTLVKVHEDRPLHLRIGGHCTYRLWVGDAASHHAVARVLDPAVMFADRVEGRDPFRRLGLGLWEGRRLTDDAVALYTSDESREDFVDITVRLCPTWAVRAPILATQALAVLAIGAALLVRPGEDRVGALALLVVPTSFIVALLLVREQTSLAARLQRWSRLRLLGAMSVLWVIAIHRLLVE